MFANTLRMLASACAGVFTCTDVVGSAPSFFDNSDVSGFDVRLMPPSTRSLESCSVNFAEISSPASKWAERSLVSSGCD